MRARARGLVSATPAPLSSTTLCGGRAGPGRTRRIPAAADGPFPRPSIARRPIAATNVPRDRAALARRRAVPVPASTQCRTLGACPSADDLLLRRVAHKDLVVMRFRLTDIYESARRSRGGYHLEPGAGCDPDHPRHRDAKACCGHACKAGAECRPCRPAAPWRSCQIGETLFRSRSRHSASLDNGSRQSTKSSWRTTQRVAWSQGFSSLGRASASSRAAPGGKLGRWQEVARCRRYLEASRR